MKVVATLALLAALPALAQSPSTFRSSAELGVPSNDALHRLELPFEAYRDARRDLADIRIFNASGDAVPYGWAADPGRLVEPAEPIDIPMFPVRAVPPAGQATTEVTVKTADGTLVSVKGAKPRKSPTPSASTPHAAAWILDATRLNEPIQAIVIEWQSGPGTELLTVRVEGSDDLKAWSTLGTAPLVRIGQPGRMLLQPKVEFTPRAVKYLRVTSDQPAFNPTAIKAQYAPRGRAPPRLVRTVEATRGDKPDEVVYDLGARLPVEAVRLIPQQDNAVMVGVLNARDEPTESWRPVTTATFYRLQREGVESFSPPRELGRRGARYWMVQLAPGSSQGLLPKLEAYWTPARIVFVRQGEGLFHLAFGNAQATKAALPIESVMPNYKIGLEETLKVANVGAVKAGPPPDRWEKLVGEIDGRRATLWAVLVIGVAALGFMAWRLSRQGR